MVFHFAIGIVDIWGLYFMKGLLYINLKNTYLYYLPFCWNISLKLIVNYFRKELSDCFFLNCRVQ